MSVGLILAIVALVCAIIELMLEPSYSGPNFSMVA